MAKPKLIIAGPGGGKTYNMVQTIISKLPTLSSSRYLVVITYTNSAADNIRNRLSKRINIPKNVYIGTIHAFLNKFIVIPYSSLNDNTIGSEKLFLQCATDNVFEQIKKENNRSYTIEQAAATKKRIKEALNKKGYISFDQSLAIAKACIETDAILKIVSNRIQYLFVDEFQDTNNTIFSIIDGIRKKNKSEIYCVGDPEQFIQSFDTISKTFSNIPIIKISTSTKFDIELNRSNYRSSEKIVTFINNFNGRQFGNDIFSQTSKTGYVGESVKYISFHTSATGILAKFNILCDELEIGPNERCIIAKRNEMITRITSALSNNVRSPNKNLNGSPIKPIIDNLLSCLRLTQSEFLKKHNTDVLSLRKHAIKILKAFQNGTITNENTYGNFIVNDLGFEIMPGLPVKIDNIKVFLSNPNVTEAVVVSNIHNIKGLEADAVLAIAKTQEELLLWLETDRTIRETHRGNEKTDYPRLGYVAFSRAKKFLSIACLEPISQTTTTRLIALGVEIVNS